MPPLCGVSVPHFQSEILNILLAAKNFKWLGIFRALPLKYDMDSTHTHLFLSSSLTYRTNEEKKNRNEIEMDIGHECAVGKDSQRYFWKCSVTAIIIHYPCF